MRTATDHPEHRAVGDPVRDNGSTIQIAILGPVEVRRGAKALPVTGARLRRLLLRLAVDPGRTVSSSALVDAVWGEDRPAEVTNALQSLVSRLRRALGDPAEVHQVSGGYRLVLDPEQVDVHRFLALAASGRRHLTAGDPERAATDLTESLAMWRGDPLVDAGAAPYAAVERSRWEQVRLDALADRIDADLALGRPEEVVVELASLADAYPLRERFTGQLMRALTDTGRTAEALSTYEQLRRYLADELGSDPSPALQQQHLDLLHTGLSPRPGSEDTTTAAQPAPWDARRQTNLRNEVSSFVGRDDEVSRVDELITAGRLTTIVGPGGAGKTRLSARVAAAWLDTMPDGVWFVELAPVIDAVDIAPTILGSLGVRENTVLERRPDLRARDAMSRLLQTLQDATCLLVVDNCEHLIGDVAPVVDALLSRCPGVRVLTTTREPLGIAGEALCVLRPMDLPAAGTLAGQALEYEAVQLFADRATAVRADFTIDHRTVGDVIEIVRRLDGLPLAIELAAARLRTLPVHEIAVRLSDRFALLTGGSRTALPRHRTLRAVVRWSWDLLSSDERLVAERLAVFPSGITPLSATAVCAGTALRDHSLPDLLDALVDKSLLQLPDGPGLRYRMLETIREFGLEQLADHGQVHEVRQAHAQHFAAVAAEADPHLRTHRQLEAINRLDTDRDNILAALKFFGDSGDADGAVSLALALSWYWSLVGTHGEAAVWLDFALGVPGDVPAPQRLLAEAFRAINALAADRGTPGSDGLDVSLAAMTSLDQQLEGIDLGESQPGLVLRPILAHFSLDHDVVDQRIRTALESTDPWVRATVLTMRANLAENRGDLDQLRQDSSEALRGFTEIGDRWGMSATLASVAMVSRLDGDLDGALADYERATTLLAEIGSQSDVGLMLLRRCDILVRLGRIDEAHRVVDLIEESGPRSPSTSLLVLVGRASVARASEDRAMLDEMVDDLRDTAASSRRLGFGGHSRAIALAILADLSIDDHDLESAVVDLTDAYLAALETRDMPIVAGVGVTVARLAGELGTPLTTATILGAAAQVRGADDPTDPPIIRVRETFAVVGGAEFDVRYAEGRALDRQDALDRMDPRLLMF